MLYPKNKENYLEDKLFKNPTKEYRGTPFWSWNTRMTKEHINRTLPELKEMGMGGAHIHCRTGMNLPYLSEEFMDMVKYTHEKASEYNMLTWLYDEDRWPSGFGGGIVTKDDKYRMRFLVFSPVKLSEKEDIDKVALEASAKAVRSGKRKFLGKYAILLDEGFLKDYKYIEKDETINGYEEWYAYLEISGDSAWFNNQSYVNTLDKKAIERFIEVTHETYAKSLGEYFGDSIPAIFTDEPQLSTKTMLGFANDKDTLTIPYTDDFDVTFKETYGDSFLAHLPEIFWELPDNQLSVYRYRYHDHTCERFVSAFVDTIGKWCKEHNLLLVGHMMQEPTLYSQTSALGEAMRSYRSFGIPGIDMLCDRRELTTAKQASSAAHQYNCPGVLSEIYGVTNWDFDFRGHKLAGDWQAALGITVRVHHLTWTSMAGEAKRDYPASIGYQSPWYKEYSYIENYFARLNTALTRGKAEVKVGVIHPIESYWLYWGTKENTDGIRKEMDYNFNQLVKWLLYGLMDFDFISEALLPELHGMESWDSENPGFQVGAMKYDVILVPNCVTLRRTTVERLNEFRKRGGKIIFTGTTPNYIDGIVSNECEVLINQNTHIGFNENEILNALLPYRLIDVRNQEGNRTDNLLYQVREDGDGKWLFLSHSERPKNPDIPTKEELSIWVEGIWNPVKYDAMTGEIGIAEYFHKNGRTYLKAMVYDHDSLLYYLKSAEVDQYNIHEGDEHVNYTESTGKEIEILYPAKLSVFLSEPNVLLLDMAEYRFDSGEWKPREEILRIDNLFRERLGFPLRTEAFAQPWLDTNVEEIHHQLSLRFRINSECTIKNPDLALENAKKAKIILNEKVVPINITGWYTDRDIETIKLPDLAQGENVLEVTYPYYSKLNIEYMYLLGDFSVEVAGSTSKIKESNHKITFGDIISQGLPFYGGNISYEMPITTQEGELTISIPNFRCPVIKVSLDGEEKGHIAFSPYRLHLGNVTKGNHKIVITAFGNRINTFGTIHNCNHTEHWCGPNAWRTAGTSWSYEYQLMRMGILVSPGITLRKS